MNTIQASKFKASFGNTLDRSEHEPLRIQRRGRPNSILLSESAFMDLQKRANRPSAKSQEALARLRKLAAGRNLQNFDAKTHADPRTQALLQKHIGNRG